MGNINRIINAVKGRKILRVLSLIILFCLALVIVGIWENNKKNQGTQGKTLFTKLKKMAILTAEKIQGYDLSMSNVV